MSTLTVAYLSNRREPKAEWFFDSFHRECGGNYTGIKMVFVDFFADHPGRREAIAKITHAPLTHVPPKPTVWQGPFRLTSRDYFAAANARNTALCVAPDGYLVYVDDLSVLVPGWLNEVRRAQAHNYVSCGAYEKVLKLDVQNGEIKSYEEHESGKDSRAKGLQSQDPIRCGGSWLFGASFGAPVEYLLAVNGADESCCDSMGSEDYICGLMLEKNGFEIRYCPRMKTLESEELHFVEPPFLRIIKPLGNGEIDASHRILRMVQTGGRHRATNYADMRELRQKVLFENQPFPVNRHPEHHWVDGQPLSEM